MDKPYLNYIKTYLDALEPLSVKPTGAIAQFEKAINCKALIFDIYGTLIMSASGDIDQDEFSGTIYRQALEAARYQVIASQDDELIKIHDLFLSSLKRHKQREKQKGTIYPEVDILRVWKDVLDEAFQLQLVQSTENSDLNLFVFVLELKSNKVWPMPEMKSALEQLKNTGIPLGIVSNAQFYTPVIMNYFLTGMVKGKEFVDGFEEDLSVFSYKELKGKPDVAIYETMLPALRKRDIKPEEVIFVGNDMLKDVYAASKAGFRTIFYAGDQRAYRLRQDHPEARLVKPDYVVTELSQIVDMFKQ